MDGVYDGGEGDGVMDIVQPPSEKEIVENLYKTNTKIREVKGQYHNYVTRNKKTI